MQTLALLLEIQDLPFATSTFSSLQQKCVQMKRQVPAELGIYSIGTSRKLSAQYD